MTGVLSHVHQSIEPFWSIKPPQAQNAIRGVINVLKAWQRVYHWDDYVRGVWDIDEFDYHFHPWFAPCRPGDNSLILSSGKPTSTLSWNRRLNAPAALAPRPAAPKPILTLTSTSNPPASVGGTSNRLVVTNQIQIQIQEAPGVGWKSLNDIPADLKKVCLFLQGFEEDPYADFLHSGCWMPSY